jgi:hypothetical protein
MRLDNHGKITPEGWLLIALCAIIAGALLVWAAITLIVELWMYLVTL